MTAIEEPTVERVEDVEHLDVGSARSLESANNSLHVILVCVLLSGIVGATWDGLWHATQTFNGFFSPPHLFIYSWAGVAMLLYGRLLARPDLRRWFGTEITVPLTRWTVPSGLAVMGMAFGGLIFAAPADAAWHTAFGLDETDYSFPHAMLGSSIALITLGIVSARIALNRHRQTWAITAWVLAYASLFAMTIIVMKVAGEMPRSVDPALRSPVLRADDNFMHVIRIKEHFNLFRTNPLFLPFGAAWVAAAHAMLTVLDHRPRRRTVILVLAGFMWNLWMGMVATLISVRLLGKAVGIRAAVALGGVATGVYVYATWTAGRSPVWGLVAIAFAPAFAIAGHHVGEWLANLVRAASTKAVAVGFVALIFVVPGITGAFDLWMRSVVP